MFCPEHLMLRIGPISVWFYDDCDRRRERIPKQLWLDPRRYGVYCRTRWLWANFTIEHTVGASNDW